jgi:hypothetical protein
MTEAVLPLLLLVCLFLDVARQDGHWYDISGGRTSPSSDPCGAIPTQFPCFRRRHNPVGCRGLIFRGNKVGGAKEKKKESNDDDDDNKRKHISLSRPTPFTMMNSGGGGGGGGNHNNGTVRTAHQDAVVNDDEQPTVVRDDDDPHNPQKASFSIVRSACGYGTLGLFLIVAFLAAGFGLSYYRRHDDNGNGISTASGVNDDWSDGHNGGELYQARYRLFRSYAEQLSSNNEVALLQTNTPQAQALDWLVYRDASSVSRTDTAIYDPTLLHRFAVRYALVVLYYACGDHGGTSGSGTATANPKDDNTNVGSSSSLWGGDRAQETCDWPFVTCQNDGDGDNERVVVAVELHGAGLTGQLPVELALLSKLTRLDLSDNALEGMVPATLLAGLTNLGTCITVVKGRRYTHDDVPVRAFVWHLFFLFLTESLQLARNNLAGKLPSTLGLLTRLTQLDVTQNYLTGPLPIGLRQLTRLETVRLSYNQQLGGGGAGNVANETDFFADFVRHWPHLQVLHGRQTQLSGDLGPQNWPTGPSLRELDLSSAYGITGTLSGLPVLPNLTQLILANNKLHGPLPPLTHLPNIGTFSARSLSTSSFPYIIIKRVKSLLHSSSCFALFENGNHHRNKTEILTLQANALTGTIASDIGLLSKLEQFQLIQSNVHGSLPTQLGLCTWLHTLHITGNNAITGTVRYGRK